MRTSCCGYSFPAANLNFSEDSNNPAPSFKLQGAHDAFDLHLYRTPNVKVCKLHVLLLYEKDGLTLHRCIAIIHKDYGGMDKPQREWYTIAYDATETSRGQH